MTNNEKRFYKVITKGIDCIATLREQLMDGEFDEYFVE